MKKIIALLLVIASITCFAACDDGGKKKTNEKEEEKSSTAQVNNEEDPEPVTSLDKYPEGVWENEKHYSNEKAVIEFTIPEDWNWKKTEVNEIAEIEKKLKNGAKILMAARKNEADKQNNVMVLVHDAEEGTEPKAFIDEVCESLKKDEGAVVNDAPDVNGEDLFDDFPSAEKMITTEIKEDDNNVKKIYQDIITYKPNDAENVLVSVVITADGTGSISDIKQRFTKYNKPSDQPTGEIASNKNEENSQETQEDTETDQTNDGSERSDDRNSNIPEFNP